MRVVIAGGSGFLGSHLTDHLRSRAHEVTVLTRNPAPGAGEATWNPSAGVVDQSLVEESDVVVNVAGSPLFGNPHTRPWRERILESRVTSTRVLAEAIARAERPPAFLAGNGSSYYGDHGDLPVTESSDSRGDAFMTQVTREWQAAAAPAEAAGARTCVLRTSPVMARGGEAMRVLVPLFRLALGARLGDGRQYFPVVSLRDWVGAVTLLVEDASAAGPVNLCCPATPTNAEFTRAFAKSVGRPAPLLAPAPLLRLGAGPAAPELLRSLRMVPQALDELGYEFADRDVTSVLTAGLG